MIWYENYFRKKIGKSVLRKLYFLRQKVEEERRIAEAEKLLEAERKAEKSGDEELLNNAKPKNTNKVRKNRN